MSSKGESERITMNPEYVCYIFVNSDLKMSTGKKIAQSMHVAIELIKGLNEKSDYIKGCFEVWSENGHKTVVLKATEFQMNEIYDMYPSVKIHDAGRTQIPAGSFTMLGLYPKLTEPNFSSFKLL